MLPSVGVPYPATAENLQDQETPGPPPSPKTILREEPLSARITRNLNFQNPLWMAIRKKNTDVYHATENPKGIISMGVSENKLLKHAIVEHLRPTLDLTPEQLFYGIDITGSRRLRESIAAMVNRHFDPALTIEADHITVHNGSASAVDIFSYAVCEPDEAILIAAPYYGGLDFYTAMRADNKLIGVPMSPVEMFDPEAHVRLLDAALHRALGEGLLVRGLILVNPHNPLGLCHSRALLENILRFANRNRLHVLADEVYALSVFHHELENLQSTTAADISTQGTSAVLEAEAATADPSTPCNSAVAPQLAPLDLTTPFHSVLSLTNLRDLINPRLVHVIHGMSKDFCVGGLRIGYFISPWDPQFNAAVKSVSVFAWYANTIDALACAFFRDPEWLVTFLQMSREALARMYVRAVAFLQRHGVNYLPSRAGPFLWMDLRPFCKRRKDAGMMLGAGPGLDDDLEEISVSVDEEIALFDRLMNHGVYLASGRAFHASTSGWFRLTFALDPTELDLGLQRIAKALGLVAA
ncbi:hypothetical protein IWQ60_006009 [Tieghemiomyces parasiticus]|uniref:Aminotransferase class I/classII large domain-containing protein n=1 Tax=Tieghemiomyces parasiticus TaxID=78921 RepID=A0A9W8A555_9FUNG|nr:hypothetical protein IWQ60_006009 [Tieghemiomyces parasiticus]